jgi:uncharacterized protein
MSSGVTSRAHLRLDVLTRLECENRLGRSQIGRIGAVVDGRAEIVPVNYVYDGRSGCVLVPVRSERLRHLVLSLPTVAFEVDRFDPEGPTGWSVVVLGRAELVVDTDAWDRAVRSIPPPWAASEGAGWIRIVPESVTGRLLRPADAPGARPGPHIHRTAGAPPG